MIINRTDFPVHFQREGVFDFNNVLKSIIVENRSYFDASVMSLSRTSKVMYS